MLFEYTIGVLALPMFNAAFEHDGRRRIYGIARALPLCNTNGESVTNFNPANMNTQAVLRSQKRSASCKERKRNKLYIAMGVENSESKA